MTHGQFEFEASLPGGQPQLAESNALPCRELGVRKVGQNLSPPQALGLLEHASCPIGLIGVRGPLSLTDQSLEVSGINLVWACVDHVTATFGPQNPGTEDFAQLSDVLLQSLKRRGRRSLAPYGIEKGVGRDDPARVDEEAGQHPPLPGTAETEHSALGAHLERPQDPVTHHDHDRPPVLYRTRAGKGDDPDQKPAPASRVNQARLQAPCPSVFPWSRTDDVDRRRMIVPLSWGGEGRIVPTLRAAGQAHRASPVRPSPPGFLRQAQR